MKEAFKFDEFKPCLDWYTTEHHIINWGDYNYFKLDRRFGPSWWLYGMKLIENPYHWEEKEIGEIYEGDLRRFIEAGDFDVGEVPGNIEYRNLTKEYIEYTVNKVKLGDRKLKVVLDCGNGTGSIIIKDILNLIS